ANTPPKARSAAPCAKCSATTSRVRSSSEEGSCDVVRARQRRRRPLACAGSGDRLRARARDSHARRGSPGHRRSRRSARGPRTARDLRAARRRFASLNQPLVILLVIAAVAALAFVLRRAGGSNEPSAGRGLDPTQVDIVPTDADDEVPPEVDDDAAGEDE